MKRILAIACLFGLLCVGAAWGWMGVHVIGSGAAAPIYTYLGWPSTAGVPEGTPSSTYSAATSTLARTWTATESGTATTIQFYAGPFWNPPSVAKVVLYRNILGVITLVGSADATNTANSWSGKLTLTAESGQSLTFAINDVLYYGVAYYHTASQDVGRDDAGGPGMYYNTSSVAGGPLSTITFSFSADRDMGFILEYVK